MSLLTESENFPGQPHSDSNGVLAIREYGYTDYKAGWTITLFPH